jgi:hypothetical protein
VSADTDAAARLVDQAERHLASAGAAGVDGESAFGLCYQAALKAMIAADGVRVSSGAGSHVVVLREARRRLVLGAATFDRIDLMRRTRHAVFYDADEVTAAELDAAKRDGRVLVEAAARFVAGAAGGTLGD